MPFSSTWVAPQILARALALLLIASSAIAPQMASASSATVVSTSAVNVRACPAVDCEVYASLSLGDVVTITGEVTGGFYPIAWGSGTAYVYHHYLAANGTVLPLIEGDHTCKRVAFIFNLGIGYPPSQSVVDTLVTREIPATMFPMGTFARNQPAYLQQLADEGFSIGTHGDQALFLTQAGDAEIRQDVANSIVAIENVTGQEIDPYFTAYAADTDDRVRWVVGSMGLLPIEWRVPAADYASWATEQDVYDRVVNGVYPGAIVEFHLDGPATETSTAAALPRIIDELSAQGYEFVTIGEMASPCPDGSARDSASPAAPTAVVERRRGLPS